MSSGVENGTTGGHVTGSGEFDTVDIRDPRPPELDRGELGERRNGEALGAQRRRFEPSASPSTGQVEVDGKFFRSGRTAL